MNKFKLLFRLLFSLFKLFFCYWTGFYFLSTDFNRFSFTHSLRFKSIRIWKPFRLKSKIFFFLNRFQIKVSNFFYLYSFFLRLIYILSCDWSEFLFWLSNRVYWPHIEVSSFLYLYSFTLRLIYSLNSDWSEFLLWLTYRVNWPHI